MPAEENKALFKKLRQFNKQETKNLITGATIGLAALLVLGTPVAAILVFGFSWLILAGVVIGMGATYAFVLVSVSTKKRGLADRFDAYLLDQEIQQDRSQIRAVVMENPLSLKVGSEVGVLFDMLRILQVPKEDIDRLEKKSLDRENRANARRERQAKAQRANKEETRRGLFACELQTAQRLSPEELEADETDTSAGEPDLIFEEHITNRKPQDALVDFVSRPHWMVTIDFESSVAEFKFPEDKCVVCREKAAFPRAVQIEWSVDTNRSAVETERTSYVLKLRLPYCEAHGHFPKHLARGESVLVVPGMGVDALPRHELGGDKFQLRFRFHNRAMAVAFRRIVLASGTDLRNPDLRPYLVGYDALYEGLLRTERKIPNRKALLKSLLKSTAAGQTQ